MAEQFRQFISKDALDLLSYRSTLGQSLKQIHLSRTPIEVILEDIAKYRESYILYRNLCAGKLDRLPFQE